MKYILPYRPNNPASLLTRNPTLIQETNIRKVDKRSASTAQSPEAQRPHMRWNYLPHGDGLITAWPVAPIILPLKKRALPFS
jgi:hypothetical protein